MRPGPKPLPVLERYRRSLHVGGPDACWLWGWPSRRYGGRVNVGFGHVRIADDQGGRIYVHRLAYELAHGPIPPGLDVLHRCDVPRCCNPAHLFLGTFRDNMADKLRKGRQARGERSGMAKLTEAQVRAIRQEYAAARSRSRRGFLRARLAHLHGVALHTINHIVSRRRWEHVSEGQSCP